MSKCAKEPIVLVVAADNNYAMPLAVTVRSVIDNLDQERKLLLFIIDGGISDRNKRKILDSFSSTNKIAKVQWLKIQQDWIPEIAHDFTIEHSKHLTITAFYRLFIPRLLPEYKKIIYLDSDIVVTCDLGLLWDRDIGQNYLLAVQDMEAPYVSSNLGLKNFKELGLPADCKYFNSGVLVINLELWRKEEVAKKVFEYTIHNGVQFADQDGLNAVLADKWIELDPRWNQQSSIVLWCDSWKSTPFSEGTYNNVIKDPYIIHFTTAAKPWCTREPHPYRHLWYEYVDRTSWSGYRFSIPRRLGRRLVKEFSQLKSLVNRKSSQPVVSQ